jgi:hypothetical protein
MPVDSLHPDYAQMFGAWTRCLDAAAGTDAVKARRTDYLPRLTGQTDADYNAYLTRAMFYPAVDRTVTGLIGATMRRPPTVSCPPDIFQHLADVTLANDPLTEFIFSVLYHVLTVGRVGVLLDMADQPVVNSRPYWLHLDARSIINWQTRRLTDGTTLLTLVVLKEQVPDTVQRDPFQPTTHTRYRVLTLLDGRYVVTTWERVGQQFVSSAPIFPTRRGEPLQFIPLVIIGPHGVNAEVDKPPLLDLVDVNFSHYRNSADLEHGRHFVALPTPYVTGWVDPPEGGTLKIGAGTAWTLPNPEAKVGMLEFTGHGLKALESALEQKEKMMAVLGARMLEQRPRQGETAETVRLRQSGEHAVLETIISAVSQGLTKVLRWHTWWAGYPSAHINVPFGTAPSLKFAPELEADTANIELNRDFFDTTMTANEALALMQLYQAGTISYNTLYWNLQRGEWARPNVTAHDEAEEIGGTEEPTAAAEAAAHAAPESRTAHEKAVNTALLRRQAELRGATKTGQAGNAGPTD